MYSSHRTQEDPKDKRQGYVALWFTAGGCNLSTSIEVSKCKVLLLLWKVLGMERVRREKQSAMEIWRYFSKLISSLSQLCEVGP